MNKKTINLSILGCCVSRDTFEIIDKNKCNYNYNINNFYHISPISLYSNTIPELKKIDLSNPSIWGGNWFKKILDIDINKNLFNDPKFKLSDYLIIDLYFLQDKLYFFQGNDFLNGSQSTINNKNILEKLSGIRLNQTSHIQIDQNYVISCIDKFIDDILKIFREDQIILCNWQKSSEYISFTTNIIEDFNDKESIKKDNMYFDKYFNYIKNKIPSCHTIQMLDNLIADDSHKWGILEVHYCNEIYDYIIESLEIIFSKLNKEKEESLLVFNKNVYEQIITNKKNIFCFNSLKRLISNNNHISLPNLPEEPINIIEYTKNVFSEKHTKYSLSNYFYKLYTALLIDELSPSYNYHFFRIDKNFIYEIKNQFFKPFEQNQLLGIDPHILSGPIFTIIGNCSIEDYKTLNQAMCNADKNVKVVFLDFDNPNAILYENLSLLQYITPIKIKLKNKSNLDEVVQEEIIYIFSKEQNYTHMLKNLCLSKNLDEYRVIEICSDLSLIKNLEYSILKSKIDNLTQKLNSSKNI